MSGAGASAQAAARLVVISKADCHLCDDALRVVRTVAQALDVAVEVQRIEDDPDLHARYWDQVPVVLVDGRQHATYRVDAQRLTAALTGRDSRRRPWSRRPAAGGGTAPG